MEVYRPRVPPERVEQLRRDRAAEFDYRRTFASRPRGDGDLLRPLPYWMSLIAGGLGGMGAVVGQRAISGGLLWRRVAQTVPVELRTRRDSDLDACELLARAVHAVDGYPPRFADDLRLFVSVPDALGVWVAESDRGIVGHVALQPTSSRAVMALASDATGRPPDRLCVVTRLFVSSAERRTGIGSSLLVLAAEAGLARGLWPILDVAAHFDTAIRLYERAGWTCAGQVTVRFSDEEPLEELVYVGPAPASVDR